MLTISPRSALATVTGNAIVVGAAGASAPVAWLLVPGVVAMTLRPLWAATVAAWAGVLIAASVLLPTIPGHRGDGWSLAMSGLYLALTPAFAMAGRWASAPDRRTRSEEPAVLSLRPLPGVRCAALAVSQLPEELVAVLDLPDGTLRVVVGVTAGEVPTPETVAHRVRHVFARSAAAPDATLEDLAKVLDTEVRRAAPHGHVAATLVQLSPDGRVRTLRCGGPEIVATPAVGRPQVDRLALVVDPGPGHPPLGLMSPAGAPAHDLPNLARIAVVTTGYSCARYSDYLPAVHDALKADSLEEAAEDLLYAPPDAHGQMTVVGPALVFGPVRAQWARP